MRSSEGWWTPLKEQGVSLQSTPLFRIFSASARHTGYEMHIDREVKTAKKIGENELGWCLGASLPLLDQGSSGWQCKIKEVYDKE